ADQKVRMALPDGAHERHDTARLLDHPNVVAGTGLDPTDVHDVGAFLHSAVHGGHRGLVGIGGTTVVERVRGPVDDGHHRGPVDGQRAGSEPDYGHIRAGGEHSA